MSRARQVANFDPALFAADEVSGDKVSGGTIGAGVVGASVTGGAGLSGMTSLGTVATGTWEATDVAVAHGGTGASTHTANNVLVGAGTSAITSVAPGADGQILTSTGTVWQSEAPAAVAGGTLVKTGTTYLSADTASYANEVVTREVWSTSFTPDGGSGNNTTIYAWLHLVVTTEYGAGEGRKQWKYVITGDDITNYDTGLNYNAHTYSGAAGNMNSVISLQKRTLDGGGSNAITYTIYFSNGSPAGAGTSFIVKGSGDMEETHMVFMEVQE